MALQLRRPLHLSTQVIGVDCGATEVKVHELNIVESTRGTQLELGARHAARIYPRVPGFEPPSARGMLDPREQPPIDAAEREQGWACNESAAQCIAQVAHAREASNVLIGVCAPGLKTADGRGIEFALNGPRIPALLEKLEQLLASEGLDLLIPISKLENDGYCCGLGEEYGANGLFGDVHNAYYIGGGTGVAEALKLFGGAVRMEQIATVMQRAWQIESSGGGNFEQFCSTHGINQRYANVRGLGMPLNPSFYPEVRAQRDDDARTVLERSGRALAELIALRVKKLLAQPEDDPLFPGPIVLDRVVVGQRLGQLLADPRSFDCLESAFRSSLFTMLHGHGALDGPYDDVQLELTRSPRERVESRTGLVVVSRMRAAASIGAAASALIAWESSAD